MSLDIVNNDIGSLVIDFNAVGVVIMERLEGLVDREGDIISRRMPVGIDKGADGGVGLGVEFLDLPVIQHHCTSEGRPGVEDHL